MNEDTANILIAAVWAALDATNGDESAVRDVVDQAIQTWRP